MMIGTKVRIIGPKKSDEVIRGVPWLADLMDEYIGHEAVIASTSVPYYKGTVYMLEDDDIYLQSCWFVGEWLAPIRFEDEHDDFDVENIESLFDITG